MSVRNQVLATSLLAALALSPAMAQTGNVPPRPNMAMSQRGPQERGPQENDSARRGRSFIVGTEDVTAMYAPQSALRDAEVEDLDSHVIGTVTGVNADRQGHIQGVDVALFGTGRNPSNARHVQLAAQDLRYSPTAHMLAVPEPLSAIEQSNPDAGGPAPGRRGPSGNPPSHGGPMPSHTAAPLPHTHN